MSLQHLYSSLFLSANKYQNVMNYYCHCDCIPYQQKILVFCLNGIVC